MHIRNTLRSLIRTRLEATPTAAAASPPSSIVFDSFARIQQVVSIPSFAYWISNETVTSNAKGISPVERSYRRSTDIQIIAIEKTLSALETLAEEIELAMDPGTGLMTLLTESTFVENTDGDTHYYGIRMSYSVVYVTDSDDPTQTTGQTPLT